MPRNKDKTRCRIPGCRAWAMRGHTLCRSHRDPELGPRSGGAPPGNLNALRSGQYARPLPPEDLDRLALAILRAPDRLCLHLDRAVQDIHIRSQDPVKTLLALQAVVPALLSRLADHLFVAEFRAFRDQLPPCRRDRVLSAVWERATTLDPLARLQLVRRCRRVATCFPSLEPPAPDQRVAFVSEEKDPQKKQLPGSSTPNPP